MSHAEEQEVGDSPPHFAFALSYTPPFRVQLTTFIPFPFSQQGIARQLSAILSPNANQCCPVGEVLRRSMHPTFTPRPKSEASKKRSQIYPVPEPGPIGSSPVKVDEFVEGEVVHDSPQIEGRSRVFHLPIISKVLHALAHIWIQGSARQPEGPPAMRASLTTYNIARSHETTPTPARAKERSLLLSRKESSVGG